MNFLIDKKQHEHSTWFYNEILMPLRESSEAMTLEQLEAIVDAIYISFNNQMEARVAATSYPQKYDILCVPHKKADFD